MQASLEAAGGHVRTLCGVSEIMVREGVVKGVVLENGEEVHAPIVASNVHPRTTLLDMLAPHHLEPGFRDQFEKQPRRGSAFKMALALNDLPHFAAAPKGLEREFAGCQFRLAPTLDYMEKAYDDAKLGRPSETPIFLGLTPSVADPSVAPPGKHLMSVNIWHAPTKLANGNWNDERERFGQRCIDVMAEYIPNLRENIVGHRFLSPQDLEDEFGLLDANIMHLDMTPSRMFGLRPLAGWADYATPVRGLYLCGSGTWPGGTVSGVPGHNASRRIIEDWQRRGKTC